MSVVSKEGGLLRSRVWARVGLLGNPSDGFEGACLSFTLANFHAEVTLAPSPSPTIRLLPNPECDLLEFGSPDSLVRGIRGCGFHGGIRILQAMCLRFFEHCRQAGLALPPGAPGFALAYATTIPRQRGLSGSSAIATAALNCLLRHYGLEAAVPPAARPQLVLSAEAALGIAAGLQDRVVQVYGGLVAMDFDAACMQAHGRGRYTSLDPALLPPLWLIYRAAGVPGKDSGAVHSDVRARWLAGDAAVRQGMRDLAALAQQGVEALQRRDYATLAALMRRNFRLRRQLYGDAVVGETNLAMVAAADSVGAAAKLCGSGGAVVALCPDGERQAEALRAACAAAGFECVAAEVGPALHHAAG